MKLVDVLDPIVIYRLGGETVLGIDIGSRAAKGVLLHGDELYAARISTGVRMQDSANELLEELLEAARENGLEGIVAKHARSTYESRRSREWLKIKIVGELVVNFIHLIIKFLRFRCSITETPCACEIIKIPTAGFCRENIKNDRLTEAQQIRRRALHADLRDLGRIGLVHL